MTVCICNVDDICLYEGILEKRLQGKMALAFGTWCVPRNQTGIAGATSGVGRLLLTRLTRDGIPVRAIVRDASRARAILPSTVSLAEINSIADEDTAALRAALRGLSSLFICTGTTAYPTSAWRNGNTPEKVEVVGMRNLMECLDKTNIQRVVLLSSIGTTRQKKIPFFILNLFGILDAKREGEKILEEAARRNGFNYAIVRPGRLTGAPHTNVGMIRSEHDECMNDVELYRGDFGFGDCSREAAAEAMLMAMRASGDLDFSVLEKLGEKPSRFLWQEKLRTMRIERDIDIGDSSILQ